MAATIETRNLSKSFNGRMAVDDLSLSVEPGEIFGFVGPNGAGKTTTIRMIAGLLKPSGGDIHVFGQPVSQASEQVKRAIGFMPDFFGLYPDLKVWEYLDFFGACYLIAESERAGLIDGLLELVDLQHRKDDLVSSLSRGMQQRLSLARTLIHEPQVLLLDEPAAGLDPRARVEIRELLVELSRMGKTIFFSTHILSDVAEICTRVGIIEAGKLVAVGALEDLHLQIMTRRQIEVVILGEIEPALEIVEQLEGVTVIDSGSAARNGERQRMTIEFTGDDPGVSSILTKLVDHGIAVLTFSEDSRDLEEVFLHATKGLVT